MERSKIYFVADVHLGLDANDPAAREKRFVEWLRSIRNPETKAVWLLGDIWDFWYEYRDVIPREAARVTAQILNLVDDGIEVYYIPGHHDIWLYSFWQEMGVKVLPQPQEVEIGGKRFLLGHGDGLGGAKWGYRLMLRIFHSRVCQVLFNQLHPWLAFRFGTDWSNSIRATSSAERTNPSTVFVWNSTGARRRQGTLGAEPLIDMMKKSESTISSSDTSTMQWTCPCHPAAA